MRSSAQSAPAQWISALHCIRQLACSAGPGPQLSLTRRSQCQLHACMQPPHLHGTSSGRCHAGFGAVHGIQQHRDTWHTQERNGRCSSWHHQEQTSRQSCPYGSHALHTSSHTYEHQHMARSPQPFSQLPQWKPNLSNSVTAASLTEEQPPLRQQQPQQHAQLQQHPQLQQQQQPQQGLSSEAQAGQGSEAAAVPLSQAVASAITGVATLQPVSGFKRTFYKRHLPSPPAIAFASQEGRQLFQEALAGGTMSGFFKLMEQFSTQDEPAFCGLTSLSMVLNALAIDPRRIWKGAWRWFNETMLDCCRPLDAVKKEGITLLQASNLARCNGARVDMRRFGDFTEEDFRRQVVAVCSSGEEHLVVSYSRRTFGQTGDGHFSPVGGYHRARDLVLILDVARFKYPPHWVPLAMLYQAMSHVDPITGLPRGYMLMSSHHLLDSAMFTLDIRQEGWQQASSYANAMPGLLDQFLTQQQQVQVQQRQQEGAAAAQLLVAAAVRHLVQQLPLPSARSFLVVRQQAIGPADRCVPHRARDALLTELRGLPLYQIVAEELSRVHPTGPLGPPASTSTSTTTSDCCSSAEDYLAERVTLLLLLQPPSAWPTSSCCTGVGHQVQHDHGPAHEVATQWQALMDLASYTIVAAEVTYLRQQFVHVEEVLKGGSVEATCGEPACSHKLDCAAHGHA